MFLGINFDIFEPEVFQRYWEGLTTCMMKLTDQSGDNCGNQLIHRSVNE